MEKILKVGWGDLLKIVLIVGSIATAWGIQQAKIVDLERGRQENRTHIEQLSERMRLQEIEISNISSKTNLIYEDVSVIKSYLLNSDHAGR